MGDTLIYSNGDRLCIQETKKKEKKKKNKYTDCTECDERGAHLNTATVLGLNATIDSVIIHIQLLSLAT